MLFPLEVRIPVDAQLLPSDGLRGHARYGAMELDARTRLGLSASVSCADFTEGRRREAGQLLWEEHEVLKMTIEIANIG